MFGPTLAILFITFFTFAPQTDALASEKDGKEWLKNEAKYENPRYLAGDFAFKQRANPSRARLSLKLYRDGLAKYPKDSSAAWRVSMACYFVGLRLTHDNDQKKALFKEGQAAGEAAIQLSKNCAPCHFWTAINMALYGETVGVFKMLFTLGGIREHLKKSIEADPYYAYGGAYRLLGLIDQKLPGILGGNNDDAKSYFEKAISHAPHEPLNYLFLAKLLKDAYDDEKGALKMAQKGLSVPEPTPDRLEARDALKNLQEFVKELKD